jgi:hypothetical protein
MLEGKRSERVADLIHKEISEMLVRSIKDPRIGFVTITRVTVSDDIRLAKVYFSVTGSLYAKGTGKTDEVETYPGHHLSFRSFHRICHPHRGSDPATPSGKRRGREWGLMVF